MTTLKPQMARDFLRFDAPSYLRRTQGRETFAPGEGLLVKRALERARSGLWPWFRVRSSAEREFEALRALGDAGVNVPRAIDWAVERRAGLRTSVCVMEYVEHDLTLRTALARATLVERRAFARCLCDLVTRFHAAGFIHRDFYLQHVLVRRSDAELVLIDLGRARRRTVWRTRWYVKDLASLLFSTPACVTNQEKLRFLAGWLRARGVVSRATKRRFVRAITRKARRIAAHVPKDERGGAR